MMDLDFIQGQLQETRSRDSESSQFTVTRDYQSHGKLIGVTLLI